MVMLPPEKAPVKPSGKLNDAPVAPMVLYVIGVIAVFTQTVWVAVPGLEVSVMAVLGCTVMVPVAVVTPPQPPVKVTV